MKEFEYSTCDLVDTPERFTILPIPEEKQNELEDIIGIVNAKEKRHIVLWVMNESINTFFRRTSHGELRLHFGKGFKEAVGEYLDQCIGFDLEYVTDDIFRLSPILPAKPDEVNSEFADY